MKKRPLGPSDIFIGFTDDTIPSLVYKLAKNKFNIELVEGNEKQATNLAAEVAAMTR